MESTKSLQKFVRSIKIRIRETAEDKRQNGYSFDKRRFSEPFYACIHPVKAFVALKSEGYGSSAIAAVVWICFFLISVLEFFQTGTLFNDNRPSDFNVLIRFSTTSLLILVWCIVNWALCTLLDGKGTFREIWITVCYGVTPKVVLGIPLILLSNVLCIEESAVLVLLQFAISAWCVILVFTGLLIIHEYSFSKTIFSCVLTVVGMVFLLYILLLFVSMAQQLYSFVRTVFQEAISER